MENLYKEKYSVGSKVQVADSAFLEEFKGTWKYHHKLLPEQISHAGAVAMVASVGFYHGGDVLYELEGLPGLWHEVCLIAV